MSGPRLLQPLPLGHVQLSSRIAMAPLTRMRAGPGHVPSPLAVEYYAQRGSAPGTLLVTEATFISARASGYPNAPGIWSDEQIAAWKKVTDAVHANGSYIFVQLWALGRVAPAADLAAENPDFRVVGPSAIPYTDTADKPEPLTEAEIREYIADYAAAARNAVAAGFDGVEIHSANGYLLDQFLQDVSNSRTDAWGGSVENRARFTLEATRAVIAALDGDSRRVGIRLSPYGTFQAMGMANAEPQFSHVVEQLAGLDLAYLSLIESRGHSESASTSAADDVTRELDPFVARWPKNSPLLIAGGYSPSKAHRVVDDYYPDHAIVAVFGRFFISTPDLVERVRRGIDLNPYDRSTFYGGDAKGYTDYPFAAKA